ncbi:hypothetical protein CN495_29510 [Bacillus thuringiensis]|uniref:Uncharacterized protein n=1 Tax=Bacillus thuringiensis TaxID=1428 RepID=A0ABD6S4R6_BACTU|nr:hypothetical protein [Bacillus thuringiensis]PER43998.1 hypothetical protein CN495_29510 [Bacillus thuringiensis]
MNPGKWEQKNAKHTILTIHQEFVQLGKQLVVQQNRIHLSSSPSFRSSHTNLSETFYKSDLYTIAMLLGIFPFGEYRESCTSNHL